jgi:ABC-type oligopeptide transport system ATPase subunit
MLGSSPERFIIQGKCQVIVMWLIQILEITESKDVIEENVNEPYNQSLFEKYPSWSPPTNKSA